MSRCDYDGVFYRVFCVTLLATAFTFTVILTNVFIDIDGLLSKKAKQNHETAGNVGFKENMKISETTNHPDDPTTENIFDKNYIDDQSETSYRTKRSLDSPSLVSDFHNNKKINILAAQLTRLLESIDIKDEDVSTEYFDRDEETTVDFDFPKIPFDEEYVYNYDESKRKKKTDKTLHPAMHRISQQGIFEDVEADGISKTISKLLKNFNKRISVQSKGNKINVNNKDEIKLRNFQISSLEKSKLLEELVRCKRLQKEIMKTITKQNKPVAKENFNPSSQKGPDYVMKTIIEIKPLDINEVKSKISDSQENVKGTNEITYKLHNRKNNKEEHKPVLKLKILGQNTRSEKTESYNVLDAIPKHANRFYYLKRALEYLRKYSTFNNDRLAIVSRLVEKNNTNRWKRQIKVRYENYDASTPKIKPVRKGMKKADDELYVEIETHFDGSGAKGERKKKLVKNLIDRIQKAIRSDGQFNGDRKKSHQRLQIKKRIQNPLKHKPSTKNVMKMNSVEHRQLNPINKILEVKEIPQDGEVRSVDNLEELYNSPNSFSMPNIENSVEAGTSEYNNILSSGIPQRIQVPLNIRNPDMPGKLKNAYADAGNVTLFIKDIDGSGFSVGFNQYVDEPPDVDSMKLFSGLENLIKTYHEDYDQNNNENNNVNEIEDSVEKQHELMKRDVDLEKNDHVLFRRSIQEVQNDYHSDAYKIIFDKKMLPYANYEDILHQPNRKTMPSNYEYKIRNYDYNPKNIKIFTKDIKIKSLPIVLNDEIFDKKLRPSEIFSLANLLLHGVENRKKRSLNVRKITNLKSRIKLARFINTKKMESKSVFFKNKRNKRAVDKIRIIASDHLHSPTRQSEENVYLVSGENLFSNRALLREIELPESDTGDEAGVEQRNDETMPFIFEEPNPNKETNYITNIFDTKYGQNALMSRYPHIFTGSTRDSKEEVQSGNVNELLIKRGNKQQLKLENLLGMHVADNNASPEKDARIPDIVNAIMPSKSNYKVTVKILPKNITNAPSGFKEMHTVINKTYNNNGVQYYSLVNVSEISKIEKINKTKENVNYLGNGIKLTDDSKIQEQENNMKLLLALQKEKIEQQLQHLNKEKEGLESILRDRDGIKERNIHDLFKDFMHLEPSKPNDDLDFLHDMSHLHVHSPPTVEPITDSNILLPTTNHDLSLKVEPPKEPENNKVDTPIKENEHLTNEILSKINKNTDILECFLKKLSDKLDKTSIAQTTHSPPVIERVTEDTSHLRAHPDLPKDWGLNVHHLHDSFFNEHTPNKNDTHYAIPFVYAYQHPYLPLNKPPLPMAKIVYHGHIHTNNLHKYPGDGRKYNANIANNSKLSHPSTSASSPNHEGNKFFIDSLARDVIVVPPKLVQKTEFPAAVVNATQIH